MTPSEYIRLFESQTPASGPVEGICTRIIRIGEPVHRERLSGDDPKRKIVFVSNAAASAELLGKNGWDCLMAIGYPDDWVRNDLLPPGPDHRDFEMIAFPETSSHPATWEGFLGVVATAYPEVAEDCRKHLPALKSISRFKGRGWDYYGQCLGWNIGDQKKDSPNYMTLGNYLKSPRTIGHFRAFLAHSCYANKLFSGDGYTYNDAGEKQAEEFVMPDMRINDIKGVARCDMTVAAP